LNNKMNYIITRASWANKHLATPFVGHLCNALQTQWFNGPSPSRSVASLYNMPQSRKLGNNYAITTHALLEYKDYECPLFMGLTTIISSPALTSNDQSNLSLTLRPNCFTMLIGTVVLSDVLFDAARAKLVISPNQISKIINPLMLYIIYLQRGIFDYQQVYKLICRYISR
jgi:hypothetical protein